MDTAKLTSLYPTMLIRNRRSIQTHLYYANGDSITFQPSVAMNVPSAGINQVPDHNIFELVSPTIFDLVRQGIVTMNETAPEAEASSPSDTASPRKRGR